MTVQRRVRALLDFEVEILEIVEERIRARHAEQFRRHGPVIFGPDGLPPEPSTQQIEEFKLLQGALRSDPAALARWVEREVALDFELEGVGILRFTGVAPWDSYDQLLPVVDALPPGPAERLRDAIVNDAFIDYAEDFLCSFRSEFRDMRFDALPPSGERLPEAPGPDRKTTDTHRQVRVELEYEAEVREVSIENIRARHEAWRARQIEQGFTPSNDWSLPPRQAVDDNRVLQEALLADAAALEQWS